MKLEEALSKVDEYNRTGNQDLVRYLPMCAYVLMNSVRDLQNEVARLSNQSCAPCQRCAELEERFDTLDVALKLKDRARRGK